VESIFVRKRGLGRLYMKKSDIQEKQFTEAFESLSDALFRHSFFRVSNREVALDLVQETFMKTWNHISIGNEIENIKAFLYRVVNNLIIDYYRKSKSSSLDNLLDGGFDPQGDGADSIVASSEISLIKKGLSFLPEKDREVIVMRYVDGLSLQEISRTLEESENAISVRLHRALKKAKEIIQP